MKKSVFLFALILTMALGQTVQANRKRKSLSCSTGICTANTPRSF